MSARIVTVSRILPVGQVKLFYDRFGRLQEGQVFYEGWALEDLEQHGRFEEAHRVIEFGPFVWRDAHDEVL